MFIEHKSSKKINRFENLKPVIQLPTGNVVDAAAAVSGGAMKKLEIRENAAVQKKSTRIRAAPKRYGMKLNTIWIWRSCDRTAVRLRSNWCFAQKHN